MNALTKIGASVGKTLMKCKPIAKAVTKVGKHKPEILAITGGVLIISAFGFAIYETVGIKDTLEETSAKVKEVEDRFAEQTSGEKTEKEIAIATGQYRKDIVLARSYGVVKVGKKYILPFAMLITGMSCAAKGFVLLRRENIALVSSLAAERMFNKFYRDNVRKDLGEEADLKYARGVVGETEGEIVTKDKDGNDIIKKVAIPIINPDGNPWRFEFSEEWFDSAKANIELDIFFIKCTEKWFAHELGRAKNVTMYEVLKYLNFKFEKAKKEMTRDEYRNFMTFIRNYGWWTDSKGDGVVDLGVYRACNAKAIRGESTTLYIEMNCDGNMVTDI